MPPDMYFPCDNLVLIPGPKLEDKLKELFAQVRGLRTPKQTADGALATNAPTPMADLLEAATDMNARYVAYCTNSDGPCPMMHRVFGVAYGEDTPLPLRVILTNDGYIPSCTKRRETMAAKEQGKKVYLHALVLGALPQRVRQAHDDTAHGDGNL